MSLIIKTPVLENQKFNAEIQAQNSEKFNDIFNKIQDEISTRQTADNTLQSSLNAEISTRQNADTSLQNNLDAEILNRQNADTSLQNNLDAEISNRQTADTTLQNNLDAEILNRQTAISDTKIQLSTQISDVQSAQNLINDNLQSQITQLQNSGNSNFDELNHKIDVLETKHDSDCAVFRADFNSEISSRRSADSNLQTQINSNFQTLTNILDAEIAARQASDTALINSVNNNQANLTAEIAARIAGDSNLQNQIDALRISLSGEISTRIDDVDALNNRIDTIQEQINNLPAQQTVLSQEQSTGFAQIGDVIYNGSAQSPNISNFNATIHVLSGDISKTTAGTYTIYISPQPNITWYDGTTTPIPVTWQISPQKLNKPYAATTVFDFDGTAKVLNVQNYDPSLMNQSGTLSESAAGNYSTTYALKNKTNYCWVDNSTANVVIQWSIGKTKITKPTLSGTSFTFDANSHSPTIIGFDSSTMTMTGSDSAVAAGTYPLTFSLKSSNYTWDDDSTADVTHTWQISPVTLIEPMLSFNTAIYTGETITPQILNFNSDLMTISGEESAKLAGTHQIIFGLKYPESSIWETGTTADLIRTWKITPKSILIPIIGTTSFTFNGNQISPNLSYYDENSGFYTGTGDFSASDCGVYQITLSLTDTVNAVWSDGSQDDKVFTWQITKRLITKPTISDSSFTFNKNWITGAASISNPDSSWIHSTGVGLAINVGNYSLTFILNDKNNCAWEDGSTDDVVLDWEITPAILPSPALDTSSFTFNNSNHTVAISNFDASLMSKSGTETASDVGVYQITCEISNSNYIFDNNSSTVILSWQISKIKLSVPQLNFVKALTYNDLGQFQWEASLKNYYDCDLDLISCSVLLRNTADIAPFTGYVLKAASKLSWFALITCEATDSNALNLAFFANHTPKNAFRFVFTLNDTSTYCWDDDTISDKYVYFSLPAFVFPESFNTTAQQTALTYTGNPQNWTDAFPSFVQERSGLTAVNYLTESTFAASYTDAGTYSGTLTPRLCATWSDGSYEEKSYTFTIDKAYLTYTVQSVELGTTYTVDASLVDSDTPYQEIDFTFYPGIKSITFNLATTANISDFQWTMSANHKVGNYNYGDQYFTFAVTSANEKTAAVTVTAVKSWKGKNNSYQYDDDNFVFIGLMLNGNDENNFHYLSVGFKLHFLNLLTLDDFTWEMIQTAAQNGFFGSDSGFTDATGELKNYFELGCTKQFTVSGTWGNLLDFGTSTTLTAVFIGANHNNIFENTTAGATFAVVKSVSSDGQTWFPIVPDDYGENYVIGTIDDTPFTYWPPNSTGQEGLHSAIDDTSLKNAIVQSQKYFSVNQNKKTKMKIFALSWFERYGNSNNENLPAGVTADFSNQQQYDYFANGNNPVLARKFNGVTYTDTIVNARASGDNINSFPVAKLSTYSKLGLLPCFCIA